MPSQPVPRNWTTGEMGTAALLNAQVRDSVDFFLAPPHLFATSPGNQTITNTTWTQITWDFEIVDTANMHSIFTNPQTINVVQDGCYAITAEVMYATNATGIRALTVDKIVSGVRTTLARNAHTSAYGYQPGSVVSGAMETAVQLLVYAELSVGDQLDLWTWQDTGGNLDILKSLSHQFTWASVRWIGSL